jgi:hypothetical protein
MTRDRLLRLLDGVFSLEPFARRGCWWYVGHGIGSFTIIASLEILQARGLTSG